MSWTSASRKYKIGNKDEEKIMHKLLSFLFALCLCASVSAQSARKVLDATAARMTQSGCVKASFRATQFAGTTPENETTGTMTINGNKFQMQTPEAIVWYDGKTQWSMMRDGDEVNMTEPTAEEQYLQERLQLLYVGKHATRTCSIYSVSYRQEQESSLQRNHCGC